LTKIDFEQALKSPTMNTFGLSTSSQSVEKLIKAVSTTLGWELVCELFDH